MSLVLSLFRSYMSQQWLTYCRSHTYQPIAQPTLPPSMKFVSLCQNWCSKVMSFSLATRMWYLFYRKRVVELVARSITEFSLSLHVEHNNTTPHIGQLLLPDIWDNGKILYRYQAIPYDGERQRYMLIYDKLWDPYEYVEDVTFART